MINNYKLASSRPHYKVGEWAYHPETLVVRYRENTPDEYEIDLEGITPVGLLDRVFQFSRKQEATPEAIGDLVNILDELLRPQGILPLPTGKALRQLTAHNLQKREGIDLRNPLSKSI